MNSSSPEVPRKAKNCHCELLVVASMKLMYLIHAQNKQPPVLSELFRTLTSLYLSHSFSPAEHVQVFIFLTSSG